MKLDEDLKDNLREYINNIIGEYSEKDFDIEKFLLFLFALYEQASSLDDFSDMCQKELTDFFGDNTENFVSDLLLHISMEVDPPNDVDRRNSRAPPAEKNSQQSVSNDSDANQDDEDDDMLPDEDDEEGDTNYRRAKDKSDAKAEESNIESTTTSKSHHHHHHSKHSHENKRDNKYQKGGQQHQQQQQQQHKKSSLPQGPPPQIHQMQPGMMPQAMAPPMKGQAPAPMPWSPYPYMYPPMGYMPPGYPPTGAPGYPPTGAPGYPPTSAPGYPPAGAPGYPSVYPYEMMYPPAQHMMPEAKQSDYDPLHPEIKTMGKMDVKPPVRPPETTSGKRQMPVTRKEDAAEGALPTKVHVIAKEGKRGPRAQASEHRQPVPQNDGSNPKTTIYVKNIPDYYNNVDALNKQLKRFGPIVNIKVDLKAKTSMIEFVKPKHAKMALSSKQSLFGNKEIILTGDLDAMNEDSNKEAKFDNQLLEKLKFLIELRKFVSEESKKLIVQKINDIKQAQKTKEVPESLKPLLEYNVFDTNADYSQIIENVPEQYLSLAEKNKLSNKLEAFGKLENFKLNPRTKTAEFKFYNLDSAKKAEEAMANELPLRFVNDKVHEVVEKINEFEETFLLNEPKKNSEENGNSQLHEEIPAAS